MIDLFFFLEGKLKYQASAMAISNSSFLSLYTS